MPADHLAVTERAQFDALAADGRPVPVVHDILADLSTPLGAYWRLAHDEPCSFLLESVTGGEQLARYSYIGVRPRRVLRTKGRRVEDCGPEGRSAQTPATSAPKMPTRHLR